MEDIIPFMINIYTTKRWRELMTEVDALLAFIRKLVEEHEETFDPSM